MSRLIRPRRSSARPLSTRRVMVLSTVTLTLAALFLWTGLNAPNSIPGRSYYTVTAQLGDAANLTAHTQIRVAGKLVGQVLNPRYEHGHAIVELQLESELKPLRADASIRVRPRSAVGSPYVDLSPGHSAVPLPSGAVIASDRSSAAVPVDEVLSALDTRTRARTRELIADLGVATAGRGDDLSDALGAAPGLVRDARSAMTPLRQDPIAIPSFLHGGAAVLDAVAPLSGSVATGWRPGGQVLDALNQRASLSQALDLAPSALLAAETGLARTDPLLNAIDRFSVRALPVLQDAPGALGQTAAMLTSANRNVGSLRRTLVRAQAAVAPALALLRTTVVVAPALESAMAALRPILDELAPRRCDMLLLTDGWSGFLARGNAAGNVLRLAITTAGFDSINGIRNPNLRNPGAHKDPYPAPCVTKTQKAPR